MFGSNAIKRIYKFSNFETLFLVLQILNIAILQLLKSFKNIICLDMNITK